MAMVPAYEQSKSTVDKAKASIKPMTSQRIIQEAMAECQARATYHKTLYIYFLTEAQPFYNDSNEPYYAIGDMCFTMAFIALGKFRKSGTAEQIKSYFQEYFKLKSAFYKNLLAIFENGKKHNIDIICRMLEEEIFEKPNGLLVDKDKSPNFVAYENIFLQQVKDKLEKAASPHYQDFQHFVLFKKRTDSKKKKAWTFLVDFGFCANKITTLEDNIEACGKRLALRGSAVKNIPDTDALPHRCDTLIHICNRALFADLGERPKLFEQSYRDCQMLVEKNIEDFKENNSFQKTQKLLENLREFFDNYVIYVDYLKNMQANIDKCPRYVGEFVEMARAIEISGNNIASYARALSKNWNAGMEWIPAWRNNEDIEELNKFLGNLTQQADSISAQAKICCLRYRLASHKDSMLALSAMLEELQMYELQAKDMHSGVKAKIDACKIERDKKIAQNVEAERKQAEEMRAYVLQMQQEKKEQLRVFREKQAKEKVPRAAEKKAALIAQASVSSKAGIRTGKDEKEDDEFQKMQESAKHAFKNLSPKYKTLVGEIFSKPIPHYVIAYQNVVGLIETLGGSVESANGSHRKVTLFSSFGYFDFEEDEDTETAEVTSLVKPHKKGVQKGTLSRWDIANIASLFERLGVTATLMQLPDPAVVPSQKISP